MLALAMHCFAYGICLFYLLSVNPIDFALSNVFISSCSFLYPHQVGPSSSMD